MVESNYPNFLNVIDATKDFANPLADDEPASFVNEVEVIKVENDGHDSDETAHAPSSSHFVNSKRAINDNKDETLKPVDNSNEILSTDRTNESERKPDLGTQIVQLTLQKHKKTANYT